MYMKLRKAMFDVKIIKQGGAFQWKKTANQLGRVLYDTSRNPALDMAVKKILSQRPILAFILKNAVSDFEKFSMDEIQGMIDTPHISSIAVDPGSTNDMITGEPKDYGETEISDLRR